MKNRVIFIVGSTATGKSRTAIELAREINGEIISCDSMQIYKGMPILTQAPSEKDRKGIPHHLMSEVPPDKEYSAAEFSKRAAKLIKNIIKKRKTPIVVGGTGLYVKALVDGLFPSPKKDLDLRKNLESEAARYGSAFLYDELKEIDPEASHNIHPNDTRRIIRALEIYYSTGIPISVHKKNTKGIKDFYEIAQLGLNIPRQELYKKINARVEKMFRDGLVRETKALFESNLSITAKSAIGIKEIRDYLGGKYNLKETKETLKKNTRRYAKRQSTWFKRDKRIKWFSDGKSLINYCRFAR
ncbi:MAG: tRNA (adenosine(37)-N6)-dimethylallyltransferase MiaA [Candidatus Omnitrophica bacterium]|nr:tRNA (adenosine(37)-N6)-dimethylallyltransferase MiaA [Candidatus Omnitrophota bacterium]